MRGLINPAGAHYVRFLRGLRADIVRGQRTAGARGRRPLVRPGIRTADACLAVHVVGHERVAAGAGVDRWASRIQTVDTAMAEQADVCDDAQVAALVDRVRAEHGRVDVLVCNANTVQPPFEPLASLPWDAFVGKVVGELAGSYHLTQRVLPIMREQRAGRIIYISSTVADMVGIIAAHSTAKAALNTFSRHVAADAGQYGVTVNTIAFGAVNTDATADVFDDDRCW